MTRLLTITLLLLCAAGWGQQLNKGFIQTYPQQVTGLGGFVSVGGGGAPVFGWSDLMADTSIIAIYDIDSVTSVTGGLIYWDLKYGNRSLSAEKASGYTVPYVVYKITATQANYFFTGCQIGDYYVGLESPWKTLSANNKVKQVLGHHLTQGVDANKPTNGTFDGSNDFMKTYAFTLNQPEFIFFVGKQVTWTLNDRIYDGISDQTGGLCQSTATPKITIDAFGGAMGTDTMPLNTLCIVRSYFISPYGKNIADNRKIIMGSNLGPIGSRDMGGFTLGSRGTTAGYGNIYFRALVIRKDTTTETKELEIYNYLTARYGINKPDVRNTFDNGKVVIGVDGSTDYCDAALPVFVAQGVKGVIWAETDHLNAGTGTLMSWTDLQDWKTAGMDIQYHPDSSYLGKSVAYDMAILQRDINYFIANGFSPFKHVAYMGNTYDANMKAAVKAMGMTGRSGPYPYEFRKPQRDFQTLGNDNIGGYSLATFQAAVDKAKATNSALIFYFHGIECPGADNGLTVAELDAFIDYCQSVGVDIVGMDDLYNLMQH